MANSIFIENQNDGGLTGLMKFDSMNDYTQANLIIACLMNCYRVQLLHTHTNYPMYIEVKGGRMGRSDKVSL